MKYLFAIALFALNVNAGIIEYKAGDTTCEGYLAVTLRPANVREFWSFTIGWGLANSRWPKPTS